MQQSNIQQVTQFPHKTPIGAIELKVRNVYEQKTGTSPKGEWSLQNLICEAPNDPDQSIKVLLKDRQPFPGHEGDLIRLEAKQGGKQGPTGVYAEDDTYGGETRRIIKVTPTGQITAIGNPTVQNIPNQQQQNQPHQGGYGGHTDHAPSQNEPDIGWGNGNEAPDHDTRHQDPGNSQPQQKAKPPVDIDQVKAAKRTIIQITNLHTICALAVERMEAPAIEAATGQPMGESQKQGATASVFIKAERMGLVDRMPKTPLKFDEL